LALGFVRCVGQIVLDRPEQLSLGQLALGTLFEMLLLPSPATDKLFSLNGPGWSLFFEMAISLLYGAVLVKARLRTLFAVAAASGALLAWSALSLGSLNIGWAWSQFHGGVARVGFGFSVGMIIARLHRAPARIHGLPVLLAAVLVGLLSVGTATAVRPAYDLCVAMLAAPAWPRRGG
jgi:peptidoglycan/LPS O-acetylase OafA/YrhL